MGKQNCQLHVLMRSSWENKNATNLLIDFDAHRSHHRMFDKQPALEDTRRNLWVQVHVPVRSRVRASTFWDGGQNFLFNFFLLYWTCCQLHILTRSLWGTKNEKTSRSHAVIYFYMKNHHEPTPRSNTFSMGNQQDDRVKTSPRSSTFFIGFKSFKIPKMN